MEKIGNFRLRSILLFIILSAIAVLVVGCGGPPCEGDSDCPEVCGGANMYVGDCDGGECGQGITKTGCCPEYKSCNGQCIPNNYCCSNSDCGNICVSGTSYSQKCNALVCVKDQSLGCCTGYEYCSGACVAKGTCQCTNDDDCAESSCVNNLEINFYCSSGACRSQSLGFCCPDGSKSCDGTTCILQSSCCGTAPPGCLCANGQWLTPDGRAC